MKLAPGELAGLCEALRARAELGYKQDIQLAARAFGRTTSSSWFEACGPVLNGDDAAALPTEDGYVLFAAEGMRGEFVSSDPWFAGYSSVMVNASDIAAMGGRPWAIVDVLFLGSGDNARLLEGMVAASEAFGIPIVGGHTTRVTGATMLGIAIVGRARRLITSHSAQRGQAVLAAVDLRGSFRGSGGQFNAATTASRPQLRAQLGVLPELAELGLVDAGKDISMAGLCGSLLMLLETSGVGARVEMENIPAPPDIDALRWLTAFPSYGFVLTADERDVRAVCARFDAVGVTAARIGVITAEPRLELSYGHERVEYWNLGAEPLTGFGSLAPV